MRKYQLVCSDLDGTLLNSEAKVSLENLRAILKSGALSYEDAVRILSSHKGEKP